MSCLHHHVHLHFHVHYDVHLHGHGHVHVHVLAYEGPFRNYDAVYAVCLRPIDAKGCPGDYSSIHRSKRWLPPRKSISLVPQTPDPWLPFFTRALFNARYISCPTAICQYIEGNAAAAFEIANGWVMPMTMMPRKWSMHEMSQAQIIDCSNLRAARVAQ